MTFPASLLLICSSVSRTTLKWHIDTYPCDESEHRALDPTECFFAARWPRTSQHTLPMSECKCSGQVDRCPPGRERPWTGRWKQPMWSRQDNTLLQLLGCLLWGCWVRSKTLTAKSEPMMAAVWWSPLQQLPSVTAAIHHRCTHLKNAKPPHHPPALSPLTHIPFCNLPPRPSFKARQHPLAQPWVAGEQGQHPVAGVKGLLCMVMHIRGLKQGQKVKGSPLSALLPAWPQMVHDCFCALVFSYIKDISLEHQWSLVPQKQQHVATRCLCLLLSFTEF